MGYTVPPLSSGFPEPPAQRSPTLLASFVAEDYAREGVVMQHAGSQPSRKKISMKSILFILTITVLSGVLVGVVLSTLLSFLLK